MKVVLEPKLVDYMHNHHHQELSLQLIHDGYSGYDIHSQHPRIRYHKPRHIEDYNIFLVDDITIYVQKGVKATEEILTFVDEKMFGIHRCHVTGLAMDETDHFMEH